MDCPACGQQTRTLETRRADGGAAVRRRRSCPSCGERFTTFERAELEAAWVRKRGGDRQRFDQAKLRAALLRACHKRDIDPRAIESIVETATRELHAAGGELSAERIGRLCLEGLRPLDRGAFLQFAGTLPGEIPVELGNPRKDGQSGVASSVRLEEDAPRPTQRERTRGDS